MPSRPEPVGPDASRRIPAVEVIRAKRDGSALTPEQIDAVVAGYARGEVAEEQMAALAMAVFLRGMDIEETARWTAAMVASGDVLDLGELGRPAVDKHSTGGVGDKTTLVLTPLLTACGAVVPQLSGRGLGHTGGTLDKLEAIPGWRAELGADRIRRQLGEVGAVVAAATDEIAPADRALYALRDVTGTVESVPLIASSILSKKLAEGTRSLVLDVKCGSGAFMPDLERGRELAEVLVAIGRRNGLRTRALLTGMSTPLGRAVGNALEVEEAVAVLSGGGPGDVRELVLALAREALEMAGLPEVDPVVVLDSGRAHEQWCRIIRAQGGNPDAPLPRADQSEVVAATESGTLARLDARQVGRAAWTLGAGRGSGQDAVQPGAGVRCLAKPGDHVERGQPLLELRTSTPDSLPAARDALAGASTAGPGGPGPTVLDVVR
jgi:thymidine phosphorylase